MILSCALLAYAFLPLQAQAAQKPAAEKLTLIPGPADSRAAISGLLGSAKSLTLNGTAIPESEIDRTVVYLYGKGLLDRKIVTFLCEEEIQARISAGTDPASFKVLGDEVEKKISEAKTEFVQQNPTVDFEKNLKALGFTADSLREEVAASLVFEKLFLPDNPSDWPEITKEIIQSKGANSLLEGLDKKGPDGKVPEIPPILKQSFRQWLLQDLMRVSKIKYANDGLPADLVLTVNDRPFKTKDALAKVSPQVTPEDRGRALQWIALTSALRQALEADKALLSEQETEKKWEQAREPYEKSIFPFDAVVLTLKRFPTMEAYRSYFRLFESFRAKIKAEINDENLKKHIPKLQDFLGGGSLEVHALLCSAWDFASNSSLGPEAWKTAEAKAKEIKEKIEAGADFEELLEKNSEFPEKHVNPNTPPKQQPNKGRFALISKNELKGMLGENDYDSFLRGYSMADMLFASSPAGILGPVKGPYGFYFVKVAKRVPGSRGISLENPNQRQLVEEDFANDRFLAWSNEILSKAKIEAK